MAEKIIMPKAGMAMEEGRIIKWLVREGETVEAGAPLLEIETDKVSMEIEATVSGTLLKILAHEGDTVPVIQTIGYIGAPGEAIDEPQQADSVPEKDSRSADYDVIVVGGGPAGYVAAIKAAQLGGKVALVEKDTVGGTCLNRGCIPTKTYLKSAEILNHIVSSEYRGIHVDSKAVSFDMKKALKNKNDVVKKLTGGVAALLKSHGVTMISGEGVVTSAGVVSVNGKGYSGKSIIYAGGSIPTRINVPGIDSQRVLSSDGILDIDEVPQKLAVIGGGVIGVELGQAFASFGSKVTIIEMMDNIVPNMDADVSAALKKELEAHGITVLTSVSLTEVVEESGGLKLVLDSGIQIDADIALLSIGRKPDVSGIAALGVAMDRGRVKVNERMETSVAGVYAPGDVNGTSMLAHAAFRMGEVAAENAMGGSAMFDPKCIPSCVYTMPEVGAVGMTEEMAAEQHDIRIGRFPFSANGRALASGEDKGFVKVVCDKRYGEILGIHIIGPGAAEMINEASVLMHMEATDEEVADIIHAHPTYSECVMEASADAAGHCIHLPKRK